MEQKRIYSFAKRPYTWHLFVKFYSKYTFSAYQQLCRQDQGATFKNCASQIMLSENKTMK